MLRIQRSSFNKGRITKPRRCFVTFGAGYPGIREAADRIGMQAVSSGIFDDIFVYTEYADDPDLQAFLRRHSAFISQNNRGYGYWIWKPFIILNVLMKLQQGDLLMYLDSGCEIALTGTKQGEYLFDLAERYGALFFLTAHLNRQWIKSDLLMHPEFANLKSCRLGTNIQSTSLLIKACDENILFVKKWLHIATDANYHFIDDTPSVSKEHLDFIEHRHDQAILTCLVRSKKHYKMYPGDFHYHLSLYQKNSPLQKMIFHSLRNRSSVSLINANSNTELKYRLIFKYYLVRLIQLTKIFYRNIFIFNRITWIALFK